MMEFQIVVIIVFVFLQGLQVCIDADDTTERNLAESKPVLASSYFPSDEPKYAVDGLLFNQSSFCFKSKPETNPWLIVDLGATYHVSKFVISTLPAERRRTFYNFTVELVNGNKNVYNLRNRTDACLEYPHGPVDGQEFQCRPGGNNFGRFFAIQIVHDREASLAICELKVYGTKATTPCGQPSPCNLAVSKCWLRDPTNSTTYMCECVLGKTGISCRYDFNIAQGKPAFMSSLHGRNNIAMNGVDGNTNGDLNEGSCFHTEDDPKSWWAVDLQKPYKITAVRMYNRNDCCKDRFRNFVIGVTPKRFPTKRYQRCGRHRGSLRRGAYVMQCTRPLRGRYVFIQMQTRGYLHLCEVYVFGTEVNTRTGRTSLVLDDPSRMTNGEPMEVIPHKSLYSMNSNVLAAAIVCGVGLIVAAIISIIAVLYIKRKGSQNTDTDVVLNSPNE